MRWGARIASASFVAAALAFACSSFDGDQPVSAPADGGSVETDTGTRPKSAFCTDVDAELCESFDTLEAGSPLTYEFVDGGGVDIVDQAVSPPSAARVRQAGDTPAALVKELDPKYAVISCTLQVQLQPGEAHAIVQINQPGKIGVLLRAEASDPNATSTTLTLYESIAVTPATAPKQRNRPVGTATFGNYFQAGLTFDLNAGLTASLGNTSVTLDRELDPTVIPRPTQIRFGPEANPGLVSSILVDNIICHWAQ